LIVSSFPQTTVQSQKSHSKNFALEESATNFIFHQTWLTLGKAKKSTDKLDKIFTFAFF
jgi:hypothetical protein